MTAERMDVTHAAMNLQAEDLPDEIRARSIVIGMDIGEVLQAIV